MKTIALIPARYASQRFPGKPLVKIGAKTMIRRVYESTLRSGLFEDVIVATDDGRIAEEVEEFGGKYCFTSPDLPSGTLRCFSVLEQLSPDCEAVVNVQGDEPFVGADELKKLIDCLAREGTQIATLATPVRSEEELDNPNAVKTLADAAGFALYFSRFPIPFLRDAGDGSRLDKFPFLRHLGLYGFRTEALRKIGRLNPGALEKAESLEQLNWLHAGMRIRLALTDSAGIGIDTPDDLEKVLQMPELWAHK